MSVCSRTTNQGARFCQFVDGEPIKGSVRVSLFTDNQSGGPFCQSVDGEPIWGGGVCVSLLTENQSGGLLVSVC